MILRVDIGGRDVDFSCISQVYNPRMRGRLGSPLCLFGLGGVQPTYAGEVGRKGSLSGCCTSTTHVCGGGWAPRIKVGKAHRYNPRMRGRLERFLFEEPGPYERAHCCEDCDYIFQRHPELGVWIQRVVYKILHREKEEAERKRIDMEARKVLEEVEREPVDAGE